MSPRPAFDTPVELDKALAQHAAEVWSMVKAADTHVFVAGARAMLAQVDKALAGMAGSADAWQQRKAELLAAGRWNEILY